jgi:hypothetical protein
LCPEKNIFKHWGIKVGFWLIFMLFFIELNFQTLTYCFPATVL